MGVPRCNDQPWPMNNQIKMQRGADWRCKSFGAPWHCPPMKYKGFKGRNRFQGVKTFTVVRNPYNRMVSDYYYYFNKHPKEVHRNIRTGESAPVDDLNDRDFLNEWISDAAHVAKKRGHCYVGHCDALQVS